MNVSFTIFLSSPKAWTVTTIQENRERFFLESCLFSMFFSSLDSHAKVFYTKFMLEQLKG